MPRVYMRAKCAKPNKNYTPENLEKCLAEVLDGKISEKEADVKFLKHLKNQKFVWPNNDDQDMVSLSDIKSLDSPGKGRRGESCSSRIFVPII